MLVKLDSGRLLGKNVLPFPDQPMFLVNLEKMLKIFDKVYISSESDNILDWADAHGGIAIKRPKNLCGDTPNIKVYQHAVRFMGDIDAFVAVQANSPTVKGEIIAKVAEKLENGKVEVMTRHKDWNLYGSVWGMTVDRLANYEDPYNPNPEVSILDESIDIHTLKDYKLALKEWQQIRRLLSATATTKIS